MKNSKKVVAVMICAMMLPFSIMEAYAGKWKIRGFVRADYGDGNRYDQNKGDDRFGITKAAVSTSVEQNNLKAVVVAGTKGSRDGTTDGDMNVKAAFVQASDIANSGINVSAGLQPLRFGLKPNGYPGDRSIQQGVEFGFGGNLPVARQAGYSIIANADVGNVNIRGGVFKLSESTSLALHNSGASLTDNYFIQAYAKDISGTGFYGVIGYESLYVDPDQDNESITTFGVGWKGRFTDISVERSTIDESISNTVGDESYTVLEMGLQATEKASVYADLSKADRSGIDTFRTGINYDYNDYLMLSAEYSKDDVDNGSDIESIDFRITASFK